MPVYATLSAIVDGSGRDAPGFSTSSTWPFSSMTTLLRCGSRWHTSVAVLPEARCCSITREKSTSSRMSELWTMKGPPDSNDSAFLSAPPVPRIGSSGKKTIRSRQGESQDQARSRSAFQCRLMPILPSQTAVSLPRMRSMIGVPRIGSSGLGRGVVTGLHRSPRPAAGRKTVSGYFGIRTSLSLACLNAVTVLTTPAGPWTSRNLAAEALQARVGGRVGGYEIRNVADRLPRLQLADLDEEVVERPGGHCLGPQERDREFVGFTLEVAGVTQHPEHDGHAGGHAGEVAPEQAGKRAHADRLHDLPHGMLVDDVAQLMAQHAEHGIVVAGEFHEAVEQD